MGNKKNNTGEENSGNWNSGNWNSGDRNSGHSNSGNENSGNRNTGHWNSGDCNSGFFNTDEPTVRMFNKDTGMNRNEIYFPDWFYFVLTDWITSDEMTNEEKQQHPEHVTTGGYLKVYDYKEAWRKAFEEEQDVEEIRKAEQLPNFDYDIFEEITGITKEDFDRKLGRNKCEKHKPEKIIVDGVEYIRNS